MLLLSHLAIFLEQNKRVEVEKAMAVTL